MGDWFQEMAKIQIDSFADANRITEEVMNQKAVDDLNRAGDLSELEAIFGRLGIDKKIESIKPHISRIKQIIHGVEPLDVDDIEALKQVIDFIECIDEP